MLGESGIRPITFYIIYNKLNGHSYLGQTKNGAMRRLGNHFSAARNGKSYPLYRAIRKHGEANFELYEVATLFVDQEQANLIERILILHLRKHVTAYNAAGGGEGLWNPTQETKDKISKSLRVTLSDPLIRSRISASRLKNSKATDERLKSLYADGMSLASVGRVVGMSGGGVRFRLIQGGIAIRPSGFYSVGRKFSEEHKAKISASNIATKRRNRVTIVEGNSH